MLPRPRRLAGMAMAILLIWSTALWIFLPYDNPVVLFFRFTTQRVSSLFRSSRDDVQWVLPAGRFPFTDGEVAFIVKTGYGTQERVPALLEAIRSSRGGPVDDVEQKNVLVVGDFATEIKAKGRTVQIHDVVKTVMEHDAVMATPPRNAERVRKYMDLAAAIQQGKKKEADELAKAAGWELDALKFIPGLELAWRQMPNKKWYIMQDDDTFILRPSLFRALEHLDASTSIYLGNAVGDYKGRFAHGGSSFILSHRVMSLLFDENPDVVSQAYASSLGETWGDKLVATTLLKVGVYLNERYSRFFNGERPLITRVQADRFCSPLVSFHGLADPAQMNAVGKKFAKLDGPVFWKDLWGIYGQPDLGALEKNPVRRERDHVGGLDDPTRTSAVDSVDKCVAACDSRPKDCLAWTWDKESKVCLVSPWIIVGEKARGKYSGVNVQRIRQLASECETQSSRR